MKMTKVPGLKKYRTSDRSHLQMPRRLWTKAEKAEWAQDAADSIERGYKYLEKGDMRSALSVLLHIHGLRSIVTTPAMLDYTRRFFDLMPVDHISDGPEGSCTDECVASHPDHADSRGE
jgi:hypothetical protein